MQIKLILKTIIEPTNSYLGYGFYLENHIKLLLRIHPKIEASYDQKRESDNQLNSME